jgi:hypothetical protein
MTNRYIISGATPGYKTLYYLLLISEADADRLEKLASSIELPKSDAEIEYILFRDRSDQISVSVVPFIDGESWREEMRSLLGDTIADAIEASMDEDTDDTYTVIDLDELSEEDRAKFKSALEEYSRSQIRLLVLPEQQGRCRRALLRRIPRGAVLHVSACHHHSVTKHARLMYNQPPPSLSTQVKGVAVTDWRIASAVRVEQSLRPARQREYRP